MLWAVDWEVDFEEEAHATTALLIGGFEASDAVPEFMSLPDEHAAHVHVDDVVAVKHCLIHPSQLGTIS